MAKKKVLTDSEVLEIVYNWDEVSVIVALTVLALVIMKLIT